MRGADYVQAIVDARVELRWFADQLPHEADDPRGHSLYVCKVCRAYAIANRLDKLLEAIGNEDE